MLARWFLVWYTDLMTKLNLTIFLVFSLIISISMPVLSQIGGQTYQRVKEQGQEPQTTPTASTAPAQEQQPVKKTKSSESYLHKLAIAEEQELTFPSGLKECKVFDSKSLEKAVLLATWKGECEWIKLRPPSDANSDAPIWLQMDKPMILQDMSSLAKGHPLIISNDTGHAMIFRAPKNGGCTVIMNKVDVAILGISFEGAVCR